MLMRRNFGQAPGRFSDQHAVSPSHRAASADSRNAHLSLQEVDVEDNEDQNIKSPQKIMFGALNRFISRLDGDAPDQRSKTGTACGFQVLRNTNTELPLEPWFDFIIGVNGRTIVYLPMAHRHWIESDFD
jgi:hypothetical protein